MTIEPSKLFCTDAITADNVDFLVGRATIVRDIVARMAATNHSAAIYGARGVGKTTLAWQVVSVLSGQNHRFDRNKILKVGADRKYKIAFHKCLPSAESYGDLLMGLLSDNHDKFSFAKVFADAFQDREFASGIQTKFGINLLKIFQFEQTEQVTRKSIVDEIKEFVQDDDAKRALFLDVLQKAKERFPNHHFLIVFDELDRVKSTSGLGNFLKDINGVQFIFVGISENIESLIDDHRSAARNLTIIEEAPLLLQEEIEEIFRKAEVLSDGALAIEDEYIRKAGRYSGGIPYIAQLLGTESVISELVASPVDDTNIVIRAEKFRDHMDRVLAVFKNDSAVIAKIERLGDLSATEESILKILMSQSDSMSEVDVRNAIPSRYKRYFQDAIGRLTEEMKIVRWRNKMLSIPEPEIRAFVGFYLEDEPEG